MVPPYRTGTGTPRPERDSFRARTQSLRRKRSSRGAARGAPLPRNCPYIHRITPGRGALDSARGTKRNPVSCRNRVSCFSSGDGSPAAQASFLLQLQRHSGSAARDDGSSSVSVALLRNSKTLDRWGSWCRIMVGRVFMLPGESAGIGPRNTWERLSRSRNH